MTSTIQQFDYTIDLSKVILWQYEESTNLRAILANKQAWYDANQRGFWEDWQRDVFDLSTANDFGLVVWAIILGQPITITHAQGGPKVAWGFGQYHVNFTRGNFGDTGGTSFGVGTETARTILKLRYFQLTSSGTVPEANRMLKYLFGDQGVATLSDNLDMTQTYTFGFALPADLLFALDNLDILPRPAGVGSTFRVIIGTPFGFDQYNENFDNGNFFGE